MTGTDMAPEPGLSSHRPAGHPAHTRQGVVAKSPEDKDEAEGPGKPAPRSTAAGMACSRGMQLAGLWRREGRPLRAWSPHPQGRPAGVWEGEAGREGRVGGS